MKDMPKLLIVILALVGVSRCDGRQVEGAKSEPGQIVLPRDTLTTAQERLRTLYWNNRETVLGMWPSAPDSAYYAVVVRRDGDFPEVRVDMWAQPVDTSDHPVAHSRSEPGEAEFELVFVQDMTGEGLPDVFLVAYTEEELAYPLFFSWTLADDLLKEHLQVEYEGPLPASFTPDSVDVVGSARRICAVSLPVPDLDVSSSKRVTFIWRGGRLERVIEPPPC